MPDIFEELQNNLEEFIEQRDNLMLVISCKSPESMYVLKTLSAIEDADPYDLFLIFADDFVQLSPYVSVLVERLKIQHKEACDALEKEGKEKLRPLPDNVLNEALPPIERLKNAILFIRTKIIASEGQNRLVWGFFPLNIKGKDEYLRMINELIPWSGIERWMRGLRIIVRDDSDSPILTKYLNDAPRVQFYNPDLSPDAFMKSMEEKASDPSTPDEDRAFSLLNLACMDYAEERYDSALSKYRQLLAYYQDTQNFAMQAFVINSIGDVFHRSGDLHKAQEWYECAINPATEAKSPVILLSIAKNLGHVAYKLKQYSLAEEYFEGANKLAGELRDAESKAEALELIGLCQEQQKKYDKAIENWNIASRLCRNLGMNDYLKKNLEHLRDIYKKQHLRDERIKVEEELERLQKEG